jgi:hypothetical protein
MKKYLLGFAAIVLAIGFSAFTAKKTLVQDQFFIYDSGNQKDIDSYIPTPSQPADCPNASTNCFFLVRDLNGDNVISVTEFETAFELLDGDLGGSDNDNLNDENEISSPGTNRVYQKKG